GLVVAHDAHLGPELAEVLHKVVGERVVVVDHEDSHVHAQSACRQASSTASMTAADFATDSWYSQAGLASATVPPPACTRATPSLTTTVRMWIAVCGSPV